MAHVTVNTRDTAWYTEVHDVHRVLKLKNQNVKLAARPPVFFLRPRGVRHAFVKLFKSAPRTSPNHSVRLVRKYCFGARNTDNTQTVCTCSEIEAYYSIPVYGIGTANSHQGSSFDSGPFCFSRNNRSASRTCLKSFPATKKSRKNWARGRSRVKGTRRRPY